MFILIDLLMNEEYNCIGKDTSNPIGSKREGGLDDGNPFPATASGIVDGFNSCKSFCCHRSFLDGQKCKGNDPPRDIVGIEQF